MRRCLYVLLTTLILISSSLGSGWAAVRYWVAAGSSGTWSNTNNWSATSGGAGGSSVPGSNDYAIFDGAKQTRCVLDVKVSVSSLTISTSSIGGYVGNVDVSTRTLTIRQNFTMNNGTFYARTSSITVQGNWTVDPAALFVANTSTVTFTGTTAGNTISTGNDPFYRLAVTGTGGWTATTYQITVSSFLAISAGTLANTGNSSMTVTGSINMTGGTLNLQGNLWLAGGWLRNTGATITSFSTATVVVVGNGQVGGTGGTFLPTFISSGNATTTTLAGRLTVQGQLINTRGHTLDPSVNNYSITLSSDLLNSGSYTTRTTSITFNGSGLDQRIQSNNSTFYSFAFKGPGSWQLSTNQLTISSWVAVNNGTLEIVNASMTVVGSPIVFSGGSLFIGHDLAIKGGFFGNAGSVTSLSTPTVIVQGTGVLGGAGSTQLPALISSGTAGTTTTLGGAITVQGTLTNVPGHTLDASAAGNYGITISSNWANSGIYQARLSSVTFNSTSVSTRSIVTARWKFYDVLFNGSGGAWMARTDSFTASTITVTAGTLYTTNTSSLTVTGDLTVGSSGAMDIDTDMRLQSDFFNSGTVTSLSTPTVTINATGSLGGTGSTQLPRLTLSGAAMTTTLGGPIVVIGSMTISPSHTLDVSAGNYQITISSHWVNLGTFTDQLGEVVFTSTANLTGMTTFYDLTSTTPGITLTIKNGTTIYVANTLTLTGAAGNLTRLVSTTNGNPWSLAALGTETLSYLNVRDSDARLSGTMLQATNSVDSTGNLNWSFGVGVLRTWWGSVSRDWDVTGNWSNGIPLSIDSALIVSTATRMPTLNVPVTVSTLTVNAGSSVTLNGFDVTVTSFTLGGSLALNGDENVSSVPNTLLNSSVTYMGAATLVPVRSTWTYQHLVINGAGHSFYPTGLVDVNQDFYLQNGSFDMGASGYSMTVSSRVVLSGGAWDLGLSSITVGGTWLCSTTLVTPGASTVLFNGTVTGRTITNAGEPFNNVVFNGAGGYWTIQDSMTVISSFTLTNGTFDTKPAGAYPVQVGADWVKTGGTYVVNRSTLVLSGANSYSRFVSGNVPFWVIQLEGPGLWSTSVNPLTVSTFTLNGGSFQVGGASATVAGDLTVNTGAALDIDSDLLARSDLFNAGTITSLSTPTVTMIGAATLGGTGSTTLPRLTLSGAAMTTTLGGPIVVTGSMTISPSHTLDVSAGNYQITISSHWVNLGTFTDQLGEVVFTSTANLTGMTTFYDLTSTTPGITLTIKNGTTIYVANTLTLTGAAGNLTRLVSTVNGNPWSLAALGTEALSYLNVRDSDARLSGTMLQATNSVDSTGNLNWSFGAGVLRTWWGSVSRDWDVTGNWSNGIPLSIDSALIVSTATRMPTLNVPVTVSTLTVNAGSSVTLNGFDVTVSSFTLGGSLALNGDENVSSAPNTLLNSSVTYMGAATLVPVRSTWTYQHLVLNGAGHSFYPPGPLDVNQDFYLQNGTFDMGASGYSMTVSSRVVLSGGAWDLGVSSITVGGTWLCTTTLVTPGASTVLFNGTVTGRTITSAGEPFNSVVFNGVGGYWTIQDSMTVIASFTLANGTFDTKPAGAYPVQVGADWVKTGGTYTVNRSTVVLAGTGTSRLISGGTTFWMIQVEGPGTWNTATNAVTASTVVVNGGLFRIGGSSLTATGDLLVNGGGLDIDNDLAVKGGDFTNAGTITSLSTPTVILSGTGFLGGAGSTVLPALISSGTAATTTTLGGVISVLGTLSIVPGHTLDASASSFAMTVSSNWANSGTFLTRQNTITFDSTNVATMTIVTSTVPFYNVVFNGSGGKWLPKTHSLTASTITVTAGTLYSTNSSSWTVTGDVSVGASGAMDIETDMRLQSDFFNSGTITALSTPTVTINATGSLGGTGSTQLPRLTLSGAAMTTTLGGPIVVIGSMTISPSHTLDVSAGNYQITISSHWANLGTFTSQAGLVVVTTNSYLSGSTTFNDFTATSPGILLTFQQNSTQTVSGVLTLSGTAGARLRLRSSAGISCFRVLTTTGVAYVDVQNSWATGNTLYAGKASTGAGTRNWVFDYAPESVATLSATAQSDGSVQLNFNAPFDPDDNPYAAGSQYVVHWATYSVNIVWSTSSVSDTGYVNTYHYYVSTSAVNIGDLQVIVSTGLTGGLTYSFSVWTKDPSGTWSLESSNIVSALVTTVLSVQFGSPTYDFTSVPMNTSTMSVTSIVVTNGGNATETYSLSVDTTGVNTMWAVDTTPPTSLDTFLLYGAFNATQPALGAFANEDILTPTPAAATGTKFSVGGQTGVSTSPSSTRALWLRLDMPLATSTTDQQLMNVTISATSP